MTEAKREQKTVIMKLRGVKMSEQEAGQKAKKSNSSLSLQTLFKTDRVVSGGVINVA